MWFQQELPYPDIDLGALKGSSADVFPLEFADKVMKDGSYRLAEFYINYENRINDNFTCLGGTDPDAESRRSNGAKKITLEDFANDSHILM